MSKLKSHFVTKVFAFIIVAALFTPTAIKLAHISEHHHHIVCNGDKSTHFHHVDLDCVFLKYHSNVNITLTSSTFSLFSEKEDYPKIEFHYTFLSKYQQLHFQLRGPPELI